jgi:hypothetical protein
MGYNEDAIRKLEEVHALLPEDQLTTQLLAELKPQRQSTEGLPQPGTG